MQHCLRALLRLMVTLLLLPILFLVWLVLAFLNLIHYLSVFARNPVPLERAPRSGLATIIILNWNGKDLLAQGLPSVIEAVKMNGRSHEILVVDNGSTDGSIEYLKESFPAVRVLALEKNLGFAEGNNAGVRAASHDIVILLNNDMVVNPGFLAPLLQGFGPKTFAVSSQIYFQDSSKRREETGRTTATFRRGMIDYSHREIDLSTNRRKCYPVFWAGGGSSAFDREKFLSLGGFQKIYSPAYVEDTDLSYQAWRIGWEVLLAPGSIVYHLHRASSGRRFSPSQLQTLIIRNQLLFIWKNIHSWRLLLSHGVFLPWNCYRLARDHGMIAWISFFRAALTIPSVAIARLGFRFRSERTDLQIFELFEKPGIYFSAQAQRQLSAENTNTKPRVLWITAYLPHTGRHAGAARMFQLLKRLSSKYQITLISFLEHDSEKDFVPEVEPFCREVIAFKRARPARWQLFAYEPFDEFLTPEMQQAVDRCLEEDDYDLIQLEYSQMACYADRCGDIRTLLTKHEVDFAACARRARRETNPASQLRWFYNYLQVLDREVKLTEKVDGAICMTDSDARELSKFSPRVPIHIINTGVDLSYFIPSEQPSADARLIFVGAFQHLPNVEAMLFFCREVFPLIRGKNPKTELLIVGSGPPPPIIDLERTAGIHVTGFVPDIRPYMAKSSIYIVPLRLGVGIRGKILEAWSMGMAVVSTSVGCTGLRYEDGRNLLVADAPEQFAAHVLSLLKDPDKRRSLGEEGRKTAEQYYSWDAAAQQLDALYRRYLSRERRHPAKAAHSQEEVGRA
jgi:O-antigen biosynthesis protein